LQLLNVRHCLLAIALVAVGALSVVPDASAAEPIAVAAAACKISGKERRLGATYVTSLATTGVSCRSAEALVKDFNRCRRRRGGPDGRCSQVGGYRCSERRSSAPTQYDSRTTCRRGSRRVRFAYTQNT
jgi:hypothetical protein